MNFLLTFFLVVVLVQQENASPSVCARFYDTGGLNGNYGNTEDYSCAFCAESGVISVSFDSFEVESYAASPGSCRFDFMKIFNGPSTNSPQITDGGDPENKYCRDENYDFSPPNITSSSGTCLTFSFQSDVSWSLQGWEAVITSLDGTDCAVSCIGLTTTPTPTTTPEPTPPSGDNVYVLLQDGFKELGWVDGFLVPFWDSDASNRLFTISETGGEYTLQSPNENYLNCYRKGCWFSATQRSYKWDLVMEIEGNSYGLFHIGNRYITFSNGKFFLDQGKAGAAFFKRPSQG